MSTHTSTSRLSTLEVIQTGARRRWTPEEKLRIVAESLGGGRLVKPTARRYGLSTGQLYLWRRLAREGKLSCDADLAGFIPAVMVADAKPSVVVAPTSDRTAGIARDDGEIVIILAGGRRIIVNHAVDGTVLRRIVEALEPR